jgi:predicted nicotinamide N-methyase
MQASRDLARGQDAAFIRANTEVLAPPLVPEIDLHLATEVVEIWELSEEELAARGLPPPFWAFAWAGGQALARLLLDEPARVRGASVLDFGAGAGLAGIAAAKAGAQSVLCADIDRFACAAAAANAERNGIELSVTAHDLLDEPPPKTDLLLVGDVFYEKGTAGRLLSWLETARDDGAEVLIGDPQRGFLPRAGLEKLVSYCVKTTRALEDTDVRNTSVWRLA